MDRFERPHRLSERVSIKVSEAVPVLLGEPLSIGPRCVEVSVERTSVGVEISQVPAGGFGSGGRGEGVGHRAVR